MTIVEASKLVVELMELAEQNRLAAREVDSDELAREHVHQQEACEKAAEIIESDSLKLATRTSVNQPRAPSHVFKL